MKYYKNIFLSIFSAVMLALSFPSANLWFLAWFAFVPLFLAICTCRGTARRAPTVLLLGFLAGIIFFYCAIYWLNSIAVMATIGMVLYLALYFALFVVFAAAIINKNLPIFVKGVLIASWWVTLEFIRSNFLTGFGWALLGYSQTSFLPAIQIADVAGAHGVSFIVMFVNVVVYEFFFVGANGRSPLHFVGQLTYNRLINLVFCIFLIAAVFIYGFYKLDAIRNTHDARQIKISLIQGNIPQTLKWDESFRGEILKRYFTLTMQAAADKPDLIIWPESSFPADLELEPVLANQLFNLARSVNTYLLVGANRFIPAKNGEYNDIYNSAFLISPDGLIKSHYDKIHLVPFGEFMPKIPRFMYKILPDKINMVGDFTPGKEYTVFNVGANCRSPLGEAEGSPLHFSALICFEDVFPELSRKFARNGAQLLVNITNDGWYGISSAPFQHAQASIFRAIENRVPVVRSTNTGFSVFIDNKGKIINEVQPFTAGYKTENVFVGAYCNTPLQVTFYNRYSYVFVVICFLFSFLGFGTILFSKTKS